MAITVRPVTKQEYPQSIATFCSAFTMAVPNDMVEREGAVSSYERTLAAFDDDRMVGTVTSFPFDMTVGAGRTIPVAGIANGGVIPSARGRGIYRRLAESQLRQLYEDNCTAAVLYTPNDRLYSRYGYGPATAASNLTIHTSGLQLTHPFSVASVTTANIGDLRKILPTLYNEYRLLQPGELSRSSPWWDIYSQDYSYRGGPATDRIHVVHRSKIDDIDGYVAFRPASSAFPAAIEIETFFATSGQAERSLWQYLLTLDGIDEVTVGNAPLDNIAPWIVTNQRAVTATTANQLWMRLLDVEAALTTRPYQSDGAITIALRDQHIPENNGSFRLHVVERAATWRRTEERSSDLTMDVSQLASIYLGLHTSSALERAGLISGIPEAVDNADRIFHCQKPAFTSLAF